ncbi:SMP-30/gluconolactonase/LRE family protein [Nocardia sp. NPDC050175]|uniref:SMP-30/gluconolactonase/LRE family protein n=1 Tax=Nocardia sp. NPDC050175 TaxID=3364317 RepID=UPI00379C5D0B
MRRLRRPGSLLWPAALIALACTAPVAAADPTAADPTAAQPVAACAPALAALAALAATAVPVGVPMLDWSENVGYDAAGNLWVSRVYRNVVQRYDRSGALTATVPVDFPGAVRSGPDGLLYVVYGDTPTSLVSPGGVVRFDPTAADPKPEVFVSGVRTMPNGAAFDADGYLYLGASLSGVIRVRPDGTIDTAWTDQAPKGSANGVVVRGRMLYVTSNGGPLGRILRVPIDAPGATSVVADVASPLPGIPDFTDDLLVDSSGILYVTTVFGQLVRVDPTTGAACAVLSGEPLTSVVATPGQPDQLIAGTENGAVLRIQLPR